MSDYYEEIEEVLLAIQDAQTIEEKQDAIRAYNKLRKEYKL